MRVGIGYDIHPLKEGRDLVLGGEEIPSERGTVGHSDADVLVHAVIDALLGAAALGDIGHHFPDTDPTYSGIKSLKLLGVVRDMLEGEGYTVINLDSTLVCEAPRLAPFIPAIRAGIAGTLSVNTGQVMVKATTNEGFGEIGAGAAMAAWAVACIEAKTR